MTSTIINNLISFVHARISPFLSIILKVLQKPAVSQFINAGYFLVNIQLIFTGPSSQVHLLNNIRSTVIQIRFESLTAVTSIVNYIIIKF